MHVARSTDALILNLSNKFCKYNKNTNKQKCVVTYVAIYTIVSKSWDILSVSLQ